MTGDLAHVDPLRERLLREELAQARVSLATGGPRGLIAQAAQELAEVTRLGREFDELARLLAGADDAERRRILRAFLTRTAPHARALRGDLRALRRGDRDVLDLAALGERQAARMSRAERRAEACLALLRAVKLAGCDDAAVAPLLALAATPGRPSRRAEALKALKTLLARLGAGGEREHAATALTELARPEEERWLQPLALAALAAAWPERAHELARRRLAEPRAGDDFIVRAALVELALRLTKAGWSDLVMLAWRDSSEHVRMTAARVERRLEPLEAAARRDASPRVRSVALIRLARLRRGAAVPTLGAAATSDADALVVRTAVEELVRVARHGAPEAVAEARHAVWQAAGRCDIEPATRTACADALLEIQVVGSDDLALYRTLEAAVRGLPAGASVLLPAVSVEEDPVRVARVLAVLAREDFMLGVDQSSRGLVLHRGEGHGFAAWRAWFELWHPLPSKRQGFDHTRGARGRGALRAPPGSLAEITATHVPGRRVEVASVGGWGRSLPLVDDLLSTGVLRGRRVALATAHGVTSIVPPATLLGRLRAWATLTRRYARFAELRQRALLSDEPAVQRSYLRELGSATGFSFEVCPHAYDVGGKLERLALPEQLGEARASGGLVSSAALLFAAPTPDGGTQGLAPLDTLHELLEYALSPTGNRLPHLAAYSLLLLGAILWRTLALRQRLEHDRASIPLSIGGWGTRGKSGTERLKGAMFQGLGYDVLVKTTGCEAMFIHALPGQAAREIFIYRPYDKATVWEQRALVELARKLRVDVFLWECMALQPDLVNLLQAQWMRDDASSITNAYPDHEDVQGPTGLDVATSISEFVPTRSKLFTSEQQMLPILRERAKERGTTVTAVTERDAALISADLLARFPHHEHPRNVALAAALGRSFGIPRTMAIVAMADHVVPDLGVLRTYPSVAWRGRRLSFTNGMGANDRAGTLGNWRRTGFEAHDPGRDHGRFIVTVVNNRADRVARSEVFARILVEDMPAHRHVLIGTNVAGLVAMIEEALNRHLDQNPLSSDLPSTPAARLRTVRRRIERAFARLMVAPPTAARAQAGAEALGCVLPLEVCERLLEPSSPDESYAQALAGVTAALPPASGDEDARPFVIELVARARTMRAVLASADGLLEQAAPELEARFRAAYGALFRATLVPLHDAGLSGDGVIEHLTAAVPPGLEARVIGIQNIKGTGLDFVYRWVSIASVLPTIDRLESESRDVREAALVALLMHEDYGMVDASLALAAVERARTRDTDAASLPYEAVIAKLTLTRERCLARVTRATSPSAAERARDALRETFDFVDSIARRQAATRVVDDLTAGRIAHATAALRMRAIVGRQKR